jgi:hypothetical protein
MAGAESSGGASSVEGGAEDSGPESAESTFSLVKMERGFPPLKMTTLPRPRRARTWTAMAMRKGVEVRRAVIASHFFFLLLGSVGGVGRGVRMGGVGVGGIGRRILYYYLAGRASEIEGMEYLIARKKKSDIVNLWREF